MIKAIIFDFDGVILESVDIKTEAFRALFKEYPSHLNEIIGYHMHHGGVSRQEKIKYFYKEILKQPLSDEKLKELCKRFSDLAVQKVIASPFVRGAKELLEKCLGRYDMYVVSGAPEDEVRDIVDRRKLTKFFKGVFGSPRTKDALTKEILNGNGYRPKEVVFVGDSITDLSAAKACGVYFISRTTDETLDWLSDRTVCANFKDLTKVDLFLQQITQERKMPVEKP